MELEVLIRPDPGDQANSDTANTIFGSDFVKLLTEIGVNVDRVTDSCRDITSS